MEDISNILKNAPEGLVIYSKVYGFTRFIRVEDDKIVCSQCDDRSYPVVKYKSDGKITDSGQSLLLPTNDVVDWYCWQEYLVCQKAVIGHVLSTGSSYYVSTKNGFFSIESLTEIGTFDKCELHMLEFVSEEEEKEVLSDLKNLCSYVFDKESREMVKVGKGWSISEAKEGDILLSQFGLPFIYKSHEGDRCSAHCGLYKMGGELRFNADPSDFWTETSKVSAASETDKQLMFDEMHKIGYEWDADKKELNKISEVSETMLPLFVEGNWIINDIGENYPYLVRKVTEEGYLCENQNGAVLEVPKKHYGDYRLWTMEDLRCGDILKDTGNIISTKYPWISMVKSVVTGTNGNKNLEVLCFISSGDFTRTMKFPEEGDLFGYFDNTLATPDECEEFRKHLRKSGYVYNAGKKSLVKAEANLSPKFKVGDYIVLAKGGVRWLVESISTTIDDEGYLCTNKSGESLFISLTNQDKYQLEEPTSDEKGFEPFDRVVVRNEGGVWHIDFFERIEDTTLGKFYKCMTGNYEQCAPYSVSTKKLIGTEDEWI